MSNQNIKIMGNKIILTETRLIKNPNTKTTYIVESKEVTEVTEKQHHLVTNNEEKATSYLSAIASFSG